jgi:RNA polymerase sigma-70 factor (ECF subfamily)
LSELERAAANVAGGDASAFRLIVESTQQRLVRMSARVLGDLGEAEDVVQDSYVKAFRALCAGRFDRRSSVATWLYRIVVNASLDAKRAKKRRPPLASDTLTETAWDGEPSAEARVALAEMADWLGALPDDQHIALVLKAVEGLASSEIAAIMQCSEGAVEQRLVRARAALRLRSEGSQP